MMKLQNVESWTKNCLCAVGVFQQLTPLVRPDSEFHRVSSADGQSRSGLRGSTTARSAQPPVRTSPSISHPLTLSFRAYNLPFLQILTTVAFLFDFRADSTDSLDCLPILLSIPVFFFLIFLFSTSSCRFRAVD